MTHNESKDTKHTKSLRTRTAESMQQDIHVLDATVGVRGDGDLVECRMPTPATELAVHLVGDAEACLAPQRKRLDAANEEAVHRHDVHAHLQQHVLHREICRDTPDSNLIVERDGGVRVSHFR